MGKLNREFYLQDTIEVARQLLGKVLVHAPGNGLRVSGLITETEAYLGPEDPACHTYQGRRTARTAPMYLGGGRAYVYFIYGKHCCFNVVTGPPNAGEAILIRSLLPLEGISFMERQRRTRIFKNLCRGPGRLAAALGLDLSLSGTSLLAERLWIEDRRELRSFTRAEIGESPRIGIPYAGDAAEWPLRYTLDISDFEPMLVGKGGHLK